MGEATRTPDTWRHVAWHGSAKLRREVLGQLDELEARAQLAPAHIGDEVVHLVDPSDAELPRLSLIIGWPADLLALCSDLFHEGLPTDPLGIRQMIQGMRAFLSIPRPGADLLPLVPSFVATRLTEEAWRPQCSGAVEELLDRAACFALGDHDDPQLTSDLAEATQELSTRTRAVGQARGSERLHYELRALRWASVASEPHREPQRARLLADVEPYDFAATLPPIGVPYPADHRAAQRTQLASLQGLVTSMLAAAKLDRCPWGCPRSA